MIRSIFSASPFRPAYGLQPALYGAAMGQDILKEWGLEDIASDLTGFLGDLDGYFAKLPVNLAGPFQKRRDDCMKESILKKYPCLWDLFQDVKKALQGEYQPPTTPPVKPPDKPPVSGGLPIVPIAIGGIAVAAILFALLRK